MRTFSNNRMAFIHIRGARTHNLKNITLSLPRDRFIVITGLSGSGKSSLAFDTLYAEGQRRYVESLSAYARQFLSVMEKPDVDCIEGLSPAVAIEQKSTSHNPRSTVGTVTEIYDYLRVLFARVGEPHCPKHYVSLAAKTVSQMVDSVLAMPMETQVMLLAPVIQNRKGTHFKMIEQLRRQGYIRARIDNEWVELDQVVSLHSKKKHNIEVVIDRIKVKPDLRSRLADSFSTALQLTDGLVVAVVLNERKEIKEEIAFSTRFSCLICGYSLKTLEPRLFSFNNPIGACSTCDGLGVQQYVDPVKIAAVGKKPYSKDALNINAYADILLQRYHETESGSLREELAKYLISKPCTDCDGTRLCIEARHVFIANKSLPDLVCLTIGELRDFFSCLVLEGQRAEISMHLKKEILDRLNFLVNVGLDYLSLHRGASTLSGGEAQRIRLASQIGSGLVGVMYVLDEPSIGLHQRDNERLLKTLMHLRDLGNTVIVVEHDEEAIRSADHVVDIGPGAGVHGGRIIAQGSYDAIIQEPNSLTGQYISGQRKIAIPETRVPFNKERVIKLFGAAGHNLKKINVEIPLSLMTCVTGVSGSGKSTLINDTLYPLVARQLNSSLLDVAAYEAIEGLEKIDKVVDIDQSPIGRTPRSNPATYTNVFTSVRELFSATQEARARGYTPGRFSFNIKGGRCEACQGDGVIRVEMHFLADIYVQCDICKGQRYNRETLEIKYKDKNIYEVLSMTVETAYTFFKSIPVITRKLKTLIEVGLSYICLGQNSTTLSGGEAQRVKLARELAKRDTGHTLYILDEPTTGLHFYDIDQLLKVLHRLRDQGNTIIVIEHNLDVIKTADWIIDLGPEGGSKGGEVVASGTPEMLINCSASYTGQFLKPLILSA